MPPQESDLKRWSGVALFWDKYRDPIRQMFAPVAQALIDDASIAAGQSVLDVATGPGEPALTIAAAVGPAGKVAGIDPIPAMIDSARRAADRMGFANTQFEVASADHLPFADATFDALVCRFGAMFFASPADDVRELLRVLKPGGKLALAVWGSLQTNPFFHTLQYVVDEFVPPGEPTGPDAFRFAGPGKLRGILAQAAAASPSERLLKFTIHAPLSAEEFLTLRTEMSEVTRQKLAQLPPAQLAEARRRILDALLPYSTPDGMRFPSEVLIVSGSSPVS
jgi:ubiquinone/menaquinone biosynthesis C-methylase UbiE